MRTTGSTLDQVSTEVFVGDIGRKIRVQEIDHAEYTVSKLNVDPEVAGQTPHHLFLLRDAISETVMAEVEVVPSEQPDVANILVDDEIKIPRILGLVIKSAVETLEPGTEAVLAAESAVIVQAAFKAGFNTVNYDPDSTPAITEVSHDNVRIMHRILP